LDGQIAALDAEINRRSKADPTARRLMTIPGVGPIVSTAITALVPAAEGSPFRCPARDVARLETPAMQAFMRRSIWGRGPRGFAAGGGAWYSTTGSRGRLARSQIITKLQERV